MVPEFASQEVARVFDGFEARAREGLLRLRGLIFECAAQMPEVGRVEEALRWGQPAYLTPETKAGSTLRLGRFGVLKTGGFAIFAHCQTDIISSYAQSFGGMDRIDGNRAVVFESVHEIDPARISLLIKHGLGYHLKRGG